MGKKTGCTASFDLEYWRQGSVPLGLTCMTHICIDRFKKVAKKSRPYS
jgi:hypothetical protein